MPPTFKLRSDAPSETDTASDAITPPNAVQSEAVVPAVAYAPPASLQRDEAHPARASGVIVDLDEARRQHRASVPILELNGVTLSFGGVTAVSDIDLSVAEGEIRAVIGPNGAGKSSLINLISGIYKPDRGTIRIGAQTFKEVPAQRVARLGLARTYQNLALFKGLSVLENVVIGRVSAVHSTFVEQVLALKRAREEEADARGRAAAVIDALHLRSVRDRAVGTLPYGVQKRVELARALVAAPRILLLDEPMAGMTAGEKQEMAGFVRAARDDFNATIVLIEHDIGVVMGISDHIAVLDYGRKIADGPPGEVQRNQAVIDAYLGVVHEDESTQAGAGSQ